MSCPLPSNSPAPSSTSLSPLAFLAAIIAVLRAKGLLAPQSGAEEEDRFPYTARDLLTPAEFSFLRTLETATGEGHRVFAKVRLADVIGTAPGLSATERARAFNKIQSKHLDFILCDPATLRTFLVVELDDSSHERPDRDARDRFVDGACKAAGLPVLHIRAKAQYSVHDLRIDIDAAITTQAHS